MDDKKRRHDPRPVEGGGSGDDGFCTVYTHYLTKKRMVAAEYGYKAWPFGRHAKNK